MAILKILDRCNAKLQEVEKQRLGVEEEDGILARIDNTLKMMECLRERVTASRRKRKAEATIWLNSTLGRSKRLITVESNLIHIFLTKHTGSTAQIAEDLKRLFTHDPLFVKRSVCFIRTVDWIKSSMNCEKYGVVKERLISSPIPLVKRSLRGSWKQNWKS